MLVNPSSLIKSLNMHAFAALLATAALLAPGVLAAKPSAGCAVNSGSTPLVAAGNHTLTVNSKERWYILKLPEPYNATHPYRLIFTLHAMGGNASMVAQGVGGYLPWYGLPDLVKDEIGAIFVSPNGLE